ncbi:MAG: outer membrane protein TonB [Bacteroidota bacterium]
MFRELEITGSGVGYLFLAFVLLTVGIVWFFKFKFSALDPKNLHKKYDGKKAYNFAETTKYPEVDIFKHSSSLFNYGMFVSMAIALVAMNWTSYEKKITVDLNDLLVSEEVEVEVPRTNEPPPPPPPPPPPVIQEVPNTEVIVEDQPVFENQEVTMESKVEAPVYVEKKAAPPPPPPPPPPAPEETEIFKVVEQMPRFPGCEDKGTEKEKSECSRTKLLEYIYGNLKYPAIARENGIEGQVVLQFVVERDGSITDINIVRDIGGGCGEAAVKVISGMNNMGAKWIPGKQRGRPVRVLFTLPVKFIIATS